MADPRFHRDDEPMPGWRARSTVAVSACVHGGAIVLWLLIAAMPPALPASGAAAPMVEVARIAVPPPADEPIAIEHPIPPEQLSGYELSGVPFNLAKIAARRQSLFPFLTADLSFLERISTDLREQSAHLSNPLDDSLRAKPLELAAPVLQQLIDESWSRRDRWQRFKQVAALHLRAMNMLYEGLKEKGALMLIPSSAVESMGMGGLMGAAALRQQSLVEPPSGTEH